MQCPKRIEPHQIQGLDIIHIFPVVQVRVLSFVHLFSCACQRFLGFYLLKLRLLFVISCIIFSGLSRKWCNLEMKSARTWNDLQFPNSTACILMPLFVSPFKFSSTSHFDNVVCKADEWYRVYEYIFSFLIRSSIIVLVFLIRELRVMKKIQKQRKWSNQCRYDHINEGRNLPGFLENPIRNAQVTASGVL